MKHAFVLCLAFAASIFAATQSAFPASISLDQTTLRKLAALKTGEEHRFAEFPVGGSTLAAIRFKSVQIYADNARIIALGADGERELPRSTRVFLRGISDDAQTTIAVALERDGRFANGTGNGPEGSFVLRAQTNAQGSMTLTAQPIESTLPPGFKFDFKCGNESLALGGRPSLGLADQLRLATNATATSATLRYATVAIDTDSLFMSRLFSNNTTDATNWIASMFNTINTMYESGLQVHLLLGTTILRTSAASDPYTGFNQTTNADQTKLTFFGNYWKTNESSVQRSFTALLSGVTASSAGSCSASGIAWIDAYCATGSGAQTFGSYSVNQVCTNINIDPSGTFDARIVGHEIGHNFGAFHTHCTDVTTGDAPVSTNTIDQCYAGESGLGCYGGATTCPAGGKGTIMSYCNVGACAGTQNLLQFHPTQVSDVLLPLVAANTPSCLSTEEIFADGFD